MPYAQASSAVADIVEETVRQKPDAVIAVPAGRTPDALYRELAERNKKGSIRFSSVRFLLLTEFEGVPPEDERSCAGSLMRRLIGVTDADPTNLIIPSAENLDSLDERIAALPSSGSAEQVRSRITSLQRRILPHATGRSSRRGPAVRCWSCTAASLTYRSMPIQSVSRPSYRPAGSL